MSIVNALQMAIDNVSRWSYSRLRPVIVSMKIISSIWEISDIFWI